MFAMLGALIGGLGLFLIGMMHLTDGLKQSAGEKLDYYLNKWTNTKLRGFISGFLLTAIVQSSSAITVATIGFVNARLLSMGQAVWVVFGSNVGTTMTTWIVALIGFKVNVDVFALPLLGIGALIHVLGRDPRWRAIGGALAGFGLLFVGLDFLQSSLNSYQGSLVVLEEKSFTLSHALLLTAVGFILTVIMQSSSASTAMVLTLVNAGVVPLSLGAAAVIGANIGTTTTALLTTIGATATAKRVAWSHVVFNLFAALAALLLLPLVSEVFTKAYEQQLMGGNAAFWLAIYHSLFNLLGVLIMIPLEPHVTRFLSQRFKKAESVHMKLRYLDKNVVAMPPVALHSISKELDHLAQMVAALVIREEPGPDTHEQIQQLFELLEEFDGYVVRALSQPMANVNADAFSKIIKSSQSLGNALQWYQLTLKSGVRPRQALLNGVLEAFGTAFREFMEAVAAGSDHDFVHARLTQLLQEVEKINEELFSQLQGSSLSSREVSQVTSWVAWHRRIAQQMMKVLRRAEEIDHLLHSEVTSMGPDSEAGEPQTPVAG